MSVLPKSVEYESLPSLPSGSRATNVVVRSQNQSYTPNSTAVFDLPAAGFIDPKSMFFRYKWAVTNTGVEVSQMIGTPAYTPFSDLRVNIGSQNVENVAGYNQVCNFIVNATNDVSYKYGIQSALGFGDDTTSPTMEKMDGRQLTTGETGSFSAPLHCILSNCDKLIPAFAMGNIRIELVLGGLTTMFRQDSTPPLTFTISDFELCYKQIDMPDAEPLVLGKDIMLKTSSYTNTASNVTSGTSGALSLVYGVRLASIRSAFVLATNNASATNLWADSVDLCATALGSGGQVSIQIAGTRYPQTPYDLTNNKNGVLLGLKNAVAGIYDKFSPAINAREWLVEEDDATTFDIPAKFYIGIDTSVMPKDSAILSGVSSQNSAVSVDFNISTATTRSHSVNLLLNHDVILELSADGTVAAKR
jgi:hypothetical protein